MTEWILHHIAEPTVRGMAEEDTPFVGVLYCGLMMTARGPQVLEFNARFGDPETQAILLRLESDLVDALEACVDGRLAETELRWSSRRIGLRGGQFRGLSGQLQDRLSHHRPQRAAQVPGVQVFHSGTARWRTANCSPPEAACWA
jgi:phosphoribosylamine--glycine ligase